MPLGAVWSPEEDDLLRTLVAEHGPKKWSLIASHLTTKGSKQCRRRWKNFLNVDLKKGGWTSEEDTVLIEAHRRYGNKWTEIAKLVGGRTDNAVKNRWAALCKRNQKLTKPDRPSGVKREQSSQGAQTPTPRKRRIEAAYENGDYPEQPRTKVIREDSNHAEQQQHHLPPPTWKPVNSTSNDMKPPAKRPGLVISIPNAAGNEPQPPVNRAGGLEIRVFKDYLTAAEVQFARELSGMGIPLNIITEDEPPLSTARRAMQNAISALASPGSASGGTNGFEEVRGSPSLRSTSAELSNRHSYGSQCQVLKWFQTGLTPKATPMEPNMITGRNWHPAEGLLGRQLRPGIHEHVQHRLAMSDHSRLMPRDVGHRLASQDPNSRSHISEGVVHRVQQNNPDNTGRGLLHHSNPSESMANMAGLLRRLSREDVPMGGMGPPLMIADLAPGGVVRRGSGDNLPFTSMAHGLSSGGDMPMTSAGMTHRTSGGDTLSSSMVHKATSHEAGPSYGSSESVQRVSSMTSVSQQHGPTHQQQQQQQPVYHVQSNGNGRGPLPTPTGGSSIAADIHDGHRKLINKLLYTAMNSPSSAGPSALAAAQSNGRPSHMRVAVKGEEDGKGRTGPSALMHWGNYPNILGGGPLTSKGTGNTGGGGLNDSPVVLSPHFSNTELSLLLETLGSDDFQDLHLGLPTLPGAGDNRQG